MNGNFFIGSAIRKIRLFALMLAWLLITAGAVGSEPFIWSAAEKGDRAEIVLDVSPGYYVYLDTLTLTVRDSAGSLLFPVTAPSVTSRWAG